MYINIFNLHSKVWLDLILQFKNWKSNKFSRSVETSKPWNYDMSAAILQTICAFCFSKCLSYISTQCKARTSDHDHLLIYSASEKLSWPGADNLYKAHLFLFRKSGLIVADQLPPIFTSTQYPLSVIHTHSLDWAWIYIPEVRAPCLVFSSLLWILESSPSMTFLLTSKTWSRL